MDSGLSRPTSTGLDEHDARGSGEVRKGLPETDGRGSAARHVMQDTHAGLLADGNLMSAVPGKVIGMARSSDGRLSYRGKAHCPQVNGPRSSWPRRFPPTRRMTGCGLAAIMRGSANRASSMRRVGSTLEMCIRAPAQAERQSRTSRFRSVTSIRQRPSDLRPGWCGKRARTLRSRHT